MRETEVRLGYQPQELTLFEAAYAVATSNAYDPQGQDGHFAWCVQILERGDVAALLSG
jgi:hypothetical protein